MNRAERRKVKNNIAPIAREIANLENKLQSYKDQGLDTSEIELEMEKTMAGFNMFELVAIEDYIVSKNLLNKK